MKFKVTKIAAAVATGLGMSVVGINAAQADEILFPYIINSATVTTVLSVINDDEANVPLHYRYYYKETDNGACVEVNYIEQTSPNDIVTFDTGGVKGDDKGVLFEPVANQVNAKYARNFAVFRDHKPSIAFGIVDNNTQFYAGARLSGEAMIVDLGTGSAWGYKAYNHAQIWSLVSSIVDGQTVDTLVLQNPYDFSDRAEINGEVMVRVPSDAELKNALPNYVVPISILPWAGAAGDPVAITRLMVTPVSTNMVDANTAGKLTATVQLQVNDPANAGSFDVMYDRDENPVSGRVPKTATCVQRIEVPDLLSGAAKQFVPYGGWSNVALTSGQAVIFKLEYNPEPWTTGGGIFNNAFWLRKGFREGTARVESTVANGQKALPTYLIENDTVAENNSPYPVLLGADVTSKLALQVGEKKSDGKTEVELADSANIITALYAAPAANFATQQQVINAGRFSARQ